LIVGAGIGGLCAAIALAQSGIEVDIVEIEEESRAPGIGFGLRTNGIRAIRTLGLLDATVTEHGGAVLEEPVLSVDLVFCPRGGTAHLPHASRRLRKAR